MKFNTSLNIFLGIFLQLLVVGAQTLGPLEKCTGEIKERPSIYKLSDQEWKRYSDAIKQLNSGSKPTFWDKMALLHQQVYADIHGTAAFAGWHRIYLRILELELQKIDKNIMIPYWDWSRYSQAPEKDPALSDKRFGFDGDKNTSCLSDGTFKGMNVLYDGKGQPKEHCIKRKVKKADGTALPYLSSDVLDGTTLNLPDFKSFMDNLEISHAYLHNFVGADFCDHNSPNDPIFYSHHAFIDKLWEDWRKRHPQKAFTYKFDKTVETLDSLFPSFKLSPKDILEPKEKLCYTYPEDNFKWNINNSTQQSNAPSSAVPSASVSASSVANKPSQSSSSIASQSSQSTVTSSVVSQPSKSAASSSASSQSSQSTTTSTKTQQSQVPSSSSAISSSPNAAPSSNDKFIAKVQISQGNEKLGLSFNDIGQNSQLILERRKDDLMIITEPINSYNILSTVPENYQEVECDDKKELIDYERAYIMKGVFAPALTDRNDKEHLRVPDPLPEDFLNMMGYDIAKVRQYERLNALYIDHLNRNSKDIKCALKNLDKLPKLPKKKCTKRKHALKAY